MSNLSFNTELPNDSHLDRDSLSIFKQSAGRELTIQPGMSVKEISDIVSEKVIAIVKEQFEATKNQYEAKRAKNL
ncbi:MAG TPA: hypothetical protein VFG10_00090 [Saprospiraceae bacterium]|nr:hypothetical protein [Saprospiraceae bacterium]